MSSILLLPDNRLIQRYRDVEGNLGYIAPEQDTGKWVLWLEDRKGETGPAGTYVRAGEYASREIAQSEVFANQVVSVFHLRWLRSVSESEAKKEPEGQQGHHGSNDSISSKQSFLTDWGKKVSWAFILASITKLVEYIANKFSAGE